MPALIPTLNPQQVHDDDLAWALRRGIAAMRINLGRNDLDTNLALAARVRRIAGAAGAPVQLLFDLPGPKARLGGLARPIELAIGQPIAIGSGGLAVTTAWLLDQVAIGDVLALGRRGARARITALAADRLELVGVAAGGIRSCDSVFIEGRLARFDDGLTPDDLRLARGLLAAIPDAAIAPSFVESPRSVARLRGTARELGAAPRIVAKIETRVGAAHAEAIAEAADGLMIGRDDLSRELPLDEINGCVERWAARLGARRHVIAASSYFADLAHGERLSPGASQLLRALAASAVHGVVSDETAFLPCFRTIVETGIAHGLR